MTSNTVDALTFKSIVVGTDFQECSLQAVEMAAKLAQATDAELHVLHALEVPTYAYGGAEFSAVDWMTPVQRAAEDSLNACVKRLTDRGIRAHGVLSLAAPWEQILRAAKEFKADLIVVGTHGRAGLAHALLGSVAEKVVRMSPIPVLTVRGDADGKRKS
jgi:nucleotide-binding universal stress UspA family protein